MTAFFAHTSRLKQSALLSLSSCVLTLNKNTLSLEQEADDGCGDDDEEEE